MHVHKQNLAVSWIERRRNGNGKKRENFFRVFFLVNKTARVTNFIYVSLLHFLMFFTNIYDGEVVGRNVYVLTLILYAFTHFIDIHINICTIMQ